MKTPKPKVCKECGNKFIPLRPLQSVCDYKCAHERTRKREQSRALVRKRFEKKRSGKSPKHKKVYLDFFGFKVATDCFCEIPHCGRIAVDVHHIECRGIGGTTAVEDINNLMGLCREHHLEYGDKKQWKEFLQIVHEKFIKKHKN